VLLEGLCVSLLLPTHARDGVGYRVGDVRLRLDPLADDRPDALPVRPERVAYHAGDLVPVLRVVVLEPSDQTLSSLPLYLRHARLDLEEFEGVFNFRCDVVLGADLLLLHPHPVCSADLELAVADRVVEVFGGLCPEFLAAVAARHPLGVVSRVGSECLLLSLKTSELPLPLAREFAPCLSASRRAGCRRADRDCFRVLSVRRRRLFRFIKKRDAEIHIGVDRRHRRRDRLLLELESRLHLAADDFLSVRVCAHFVSVGWLLVCSFTTDKI